LKANVGRLERIIRITLGLVLLAMPVLLTSDARWLGLIGLVPLVTGVARRCPLYALLGLNTCPPSAATPIADGACG